MTSLTFNLPDDLAKLVSHLKDPDGFVEQALVTALRHQDVSGGTATSSKWARLVARIESEGSELGDYAEELKKSGKEFRESFWFKHDEP
jgi:hypothetical protein